MTGYWFGAVTRRWRCSVARSGTWRMRRRRRRQRWWTREPKTNRERVGILGQFSDRGSAFAAYCCYNRSVAQDCPGRTIHPFDEHPLRINNPFGCWPGNRKATEQMRLFGQETSVGLTWPSPTCLPDELSHTKRYTIQLPREH